jgi:hypothetical protein
MPAAETARLIASLELQDKNFTRGIRNVERGVGRVDKKLSAFGGFVNRQLIRGVDAFAANLVGGVFAGVESLKELEQQEAQTAAVIKSTGGAAGVTAAEVTNLAEKYEGLNALMGDEVIRSGENMLLTFRNINKEAFEPALQAGLDMNEAMGKGPEGLTSTMIQLGKALNDPTVGLTALRRVGVSFTKDQVKQIKALQKTGDLYGAQQIILEELNKEFGGSFAAQGDTTAGKVAKFHDAVEDLQRTFAKALLPIISKVADKLGELFADPKVVAAIDEAGKGLARAFDGVLSAAEKINWGAIAGGLEKAAGFAGDLVGWFGKFPDWAQALIVGGFVATKLPIVGDIFSEAAKGLIKGVLGINAGVVNVNGPVTGVGGAAGAAGGAGGGILGKLGKGIKILGAVTIAGASIVALAEAFGNFQTTVTESQTDLQEKVNNTAKQNFRQTIANLQATNANLERMNGFEEIIASGFGGGQITDNFEMAAKRIVEAQGLTKDQTVAALKELKRSQKQAKELNLKTPTLDAAILALERRLSKPLPVAPAGGAPGAHRPSASNQAGAPGAFRPVAKDITAKQQATINAVKNAQSIASRENSAQKTELANIKNATVTMDQNQKAAILAQTAVNAIGNMLSIGQSMSQVLAAGSTTSAVNTNAAATRGVAPPIVGQLVAGFAGLRATIWAARPVIQSTNVVNNYTQRERSGATSGSRGGTSYSGYR